MPQTAKRTFSLPQKQAAYIDAKVKSGGYASGSEVVRAGLRALQERDKAVERWLREEVAPTCEAVVSGQMKTYPLEDVFERLRRHHHSRRENSRETEKS